MRSNETGIRRRYDTARRVGGPLLLAAALAAGCSGASDPNLASQPASTSSAPGVEPAAPVASEPVASEPEPAAVPDGPLAEVCPSTIVVQTTGQPGVHVGALYDLIGPDAQVGNGTVTGPLVRPDGTIDDVTLEIRSGGPATAFRDAVAVAAADDSVTMVHTSISAMVRDVADPPVIAVAALTDRSRQAVVIDPVTYPDVRDLVDVRDADIEIQHFTDSPAFEHLEATEVFSPDQLVAGFDGGPASFVAAGGTIAQQGDLLVEPALFASIPQWGRPVVALPLADAGWADHDDVIAVRSDDLGDLTDCLARFVPIVQQAIVAYADDPSRTNVLIAAARLDSDPLDRVTAELLDAGASDSIALGVVGNGVDQTIGDVDVERLVDFVPALTSTLGVSQVDLDDLVTEGFIDPTVGR